MTNKSAAIRYARALFDVAVKEQSDLDQIEQQLNGFADVLTAHEALEKALLNPAVPTPRKRAAVEELTAKLGLTSVLAKLLVMLAERDRLVLVPDLLTAFRERLLDHRHVVRAVVTTAMPIPAERLGEIGKRLEQVTGRTVMVSAQVDPGILGGVIARVGSVVFDGSVTRQLEKIRARLVEETH